MSDTNMSDELRAVAEEIAGICDPARRNGYEPKRFERLAALLARDYLAGHPADDAEDPSREWLRLNGFHRPMQSASGDLWATDASVPAGGGTAIPVVSIEFPVVRSVQKLPVWRVFVYGHPRESNACPSKGYLRRLLVALGVELKGPVPT
jgi:hypothetical protein